MVGNKIFYILKSVVFHSQVCTFFEWMKKWEMLSHSRREQCVFKYKLVHKRKNVWRREISVGRDVIGALERILFENYLEEGYRPKQGMFINCLL